MHDKERREQAFSRLPFLLALDGHSLVQALHTLASDVWAPTRAMDAELDSIQSGTLDQLANWVDAAQALANRNAELLKRGEALVEACRGQSMPVELVIEVRDRVAPFLEDIALAQEQFRVAAQRAMARSFLSSRSSE